MANEKRLIDAHDLWSDIMMLPHNGDMISSEEVEQAIMDAPTVAAIPVTANELKYLMNDTITYIWRLEDRKCDRPEFGYDSRKELLEKLKKFYNDHFSEMDGAVNA